MSRQSELELYTTRTPEESPHSYRRGTYRRILGLAHADTNLWLPGADEARLQQEVFELPNDMIDRVMGYAESYYIQEPQKYRNCHVGAAAIAGAGYLERIDALAVAIGVIYQGEQVEDLPTGVHGVIGDRMDDEVFAFHSLVGIAPGLGIQTDWERGSLGLVSHKQNLRHYKKAQGWHLPLYSTQTT